MLRRMLATTLLLILSGCATPGPAALRPNIYVVRHLHTPAGATDPDLTAEGRRYAQVLAARLQSDPPRVIYASATRRAQQTAAPLAQRLAIVPKIYDPADTAGLVASVRQETGTVLVVGHSNTVPDIVERLGGPRPGPLVHEDFGDVWHISGPGRVATRTQLTDKNGL